jgi:hypothetical protein
VNKRLVAVAGAVLIAGVLAAFFLLKPRVGQALPASVADLLPVHTAVKVQDQDLRGPRRLVLGDVVETDEAGRARLRLDDGTAYVVDRNTRFAIGKNGVELERGRLFMQGASGVRSELVLGAASVILSGSNAGIERGADGGAKVYAATDELTVRAKSGEHKVRVGESAAIEGDAVRVAPERAFSDWTGGLSAPWGVDGPPRTAIGELWGRSRNNPGDAGSALTLRAHEVRATVEGESAKTTVRSTFFNGGSATVMGDFRLAIPANAIVSRFAWGGGDKLEEAAIALAAREPGGPQPNLAVLEWAGEGWLRGFLPEIQQIVAAVEQRQIGGAALVLGRGAGLVAVGGIADLPRLEIEQADVAGDRRDRRILPVRGRVDPGEQGVHLVAGVLGVESVAFLRQRVPHRRAGARRLLVQQTGAAGDRRLRECDRDVAGHAVAS